MAETPDGPHSGPAITLTASQGMELSIGSAGDGMHAVLTVRTQGLDAAAPTARPMAAEVIVVDCSSSMGYPMTKMRAAREATVAAVSALRDGTLFGIVQGTERAQMVYPPRQALAVADARTRAEAIDRARHLHASGGTDMGAWLIQTRRLLEDCSAQIRHAIMLTDGQHNGPPQVLEEELARGEGLYTCDARGIGQDWDARELTRIVTRLHGTADAVLKDSDLTAEFEAMVRASMGRAVADLRIRVNFLPSSGIRFFKQMFPTELDLTDTGRQTGLRTVEFPTSAWGNETRQYHLCLKADPDGAPRYEDLQLGYVQVLVESATIPPPDPVPVLVHWTEDSRPSTELHPALTHLTLYTKLGQAISRAYDAYEGGDLTTTEVRLSEAVRLAHQLGDQSLLSRLADLLDITDPAAGLVRLRKPVDGVRMGRLLMVSSHTTITPGLDSEPRPQAEHAPPPGPRTGTPPERFDPLPAADAPRPDGPAQLRSCLNPDCDALLPPDARFCIKCQRPVAEPDGQDDGAVEGGTV
ncbi:VWA domain-containing protein [Streptomyces sp. NPDC050164]|uniref:VWA domain-containing protein n=1 Tax=Streptomyces sp. NPDC050164 TaxID=3365605 RepID=UPI0037A01A81